MTSKTTELIFLLDRSGSMQGLEEDTMGGFNSMLKQQKQQQGNCRVTTVLFDDRYELLHDRLPLDVVRPLTGKQYHVRGTTALLDAMGRTITRFGELHKHLNKGDRAQKVVVVIITDGMENASRAYGYEQVKRLVSRQRDRFGWEFIFLGANIDAIGTADSMGIHAERAANYHADEMGLPLVYEAVSRTIGHMRAGISVDSSWKADVEWDFSARSQK